MALTQAQKSLVQKARAPSSGALGVRLSDRACSFVVATVARDLGLLSNFPELPQSFADFFDDTGPHEITFSGSTFIDILETLLEKAPDADTYFDCLCRLLKARLKFANIFRHQPIPTMEQVGPRALLQYGQMSPDALAAFLFWRKWLFDIDNRAGQETGYLFEPIIASAIGGAPFSSTRSPIRRVLDPSKGRQVDCIRDSLAYEFKLRVTIAASGQGRWQEELDFPKDCRESGFTPVLIVFDSTSNPKLDQLTSVFHQHNGKAYVGRDAWRHLGSAAGSTMKSFLDKYIREPISDVLENSPQSLPELSLRMTESSFEMRLCGEVITYERGSQA